MVFTGMPYSSWKGCSETEEERKERYQIQQEKREHEKQVKEKQIESDLKFAMEQQESIVTLFQIMLYRRLSKFLELFLELI